MNFLCAGPEARTPAPTSHTQPTTSGVDVRDAFMARGAGQVWDLARHGGRTTLMDHSTRTGLPALGWVSGTDNPVLWSGTSHLAIWGTDPDRAPQMAHLALLVATQLVREHGPDAVVLVDADPAAGDAPRYWAPLQDWGMRIHPVALDPGRAAGALASAADTVTDEPRFVVVLHAPHLVPLLRTYREHGYAGAARSALRHIINTTGSGGPVAIITGDEAPVPSMPSPAPGTGAARSWSTVEAPVPDPETVYSTAARWAYRDDVGDVSVPVALEVPGIIPPEWWATRLRDPRY